MVDTYLYNFQTKELIKENPPSRKSMDQIAVSLPPGVYSTIRTYEKRYALHLKLHIHRILEGFFLSNHDFPYELNDIRSQINSILNQECCDIRFRLHVPFESPELCYILVEDLPAYPDHYFTQGVCVKTNHLERNNPKAKLTNFIKLSLQEKELIKKENIEESIIVDKAGNLLEGISSNFFAVMDSELFTADDESVLPGITRKIVIEEALNKINFQPVNIKNLIKISEAFITSTSRNIMPVVKIDQVPIANQQPGSCTTELMKRFKTRIKKETETILI